MSLFDRYLRCRLADDGDTAAQWFDHDTQRECIRLWMDDPETDAMQREEAVSGQHVANENTDALVRSALAALIEPTIDRTREYMYQLHRAVWACVEKEVDERLDRLRETETRERALTERRMWG